MIHGETVLAVIPARGGSKRCPRKNIRPFRGQPLIAWTWETARGSALLDNIVCSTDDVEIANIAHGLALPVIWRPADLATDTATNEDVLRHALAQYPSDWVVLLQPTSPLRRRTDINNCLLAAYQHKKPAITYRPDGTKNGAVYCARASWIADHDFTDPDHVQFIMPEGRSLDIDYPADFDR